MELELLSCTYLAARCSSALLVPAASPSSFHPCFFNCLHRRLRAAAPHAPGDIFKGGSSSLGSEKVRSHHLSRLVLPPIVQCLPLCQVLLRLRQQLERRCQVPRPVPQEESWADICSQSYQHDRHDHFGAGDGLRAAFEPGKAFFFTRACSSEHSLLSDKSTLDGWG